MLLYNIKRINICIEVYKLVLQNNLIVELSPPKNKTHRTASSSYYIFKRRFRWHHGLPHQLTCILCWSGTPIQRRQILGLSLLIQACLDWALSYNWASQSSKLQCRPGRLNRYGSLSAGPSHDSQEGVNWCIFGLRPSTTYSNGLNQSLTQRPLKKKKVTQYWYFSLVGDFAGDFVWHCTKCTAAKHSEII